MKRIFCLDRLLFPLESRNTPLPLRDTFIMVSSLVIQFLHHQQQHINTDTNTHSHPLCRRYHWVHTHTNITNLDAANKEAITTNSKSRSLEGTRFSGHCASWNETMAAQHGRGRGEGNLKLKLRFFREMQIAAAKPDRFTLDNISRACACAVSFKEGGQVHAYLIKLGFDSDVSVGNALLTMYCKRASVEYARQVFDEMRERDIVSWNAMLAGYGQCGQFEQALRFYLQMRMHTVTVGMLADKFTFISILKACGMLELMGLGVQLHAQVIKNEFQSEVAVGNALVTMYSKCGNLPCAQAVFVKMSYRDTVSWNVMIARYAENGFNDCAVRLFCKMQETDAMPDQFTFVSVVKACCGIAQFIEQGQQVHAHVVKTGFESDVYVGSALVDMYGKCGKTMNAQNVLKKMPEPNLVSYNAMIAGYVQSGYGEAALKLFFKIHRAGTKLDDFTFASVLNACSTPQTVVQGKQVHALTIKTGFQLDISVGDSLFTMYANCKNTEDGRKVFDRMPQRDVISWNAMIARYTHNGHIDEALKLFCKMQESGMKLDEFTLASVLWACHMEQGKQVHAAIIKSGFESDGFVGTALVDIYTEYGSIEDALKVFYKFPIPTLTLWNIIIAGYAQIGYVEECLDFFCQMQWRDVKPDQVTLASVVRLCGKVGAPEQGKQVHGLVIKSGFELDVCVSNGVLEIYVKCGFIHAAREIFENMPYHDLVSCTVMITGYAQHGHCEEAWRLFCMVQEAGIKPDEYTFTSILSTCASLASLEQGKQIHAHVVKYMFNLDVFVGSALVDMYAKCGSIEDAQKTFYGMPNQNVVSWNTIIVGCARHGCVKMALDFFHQMQCAGMKPDHITFVGILSACSHAGLVDEGFDYFNYMNNYCQITPTLEHYTCMIDLLGRAGRLDEAEYLITKAPFEPNALVWRTLLGACRTHGNIDLGRLAAESLLKLEPQDATTYVLLSNIYAAAGRWDDVSNLREMMKYKGAKKVPGCSWIEVRHKVHVFVVGDRSHPQTEAIYQRLDELISQMRAAGYVPNTKFVLQEME